MLRLQVQLNFSFKVDGVTNGPVNNRYNIILCLLSFMYMISLFSNAVPDLK